MQLGEERTVHHGRKSGQEFKQCRDLEPEAETQAIGECCLLTCSSLLAYPVFLWNPGHLPRGSTTYSDLGHSTIIIN